MLFVVEFVLFSILTFGVIAWIRDRDRAARRRPGVMLPIARIAWDMPPARRKR